MVDQEPAEGAGEGVGAAVGEGAVGGDGAEATGVAAAAVVPASEDGPLGGEPSAVAGESEGSSSGADGGGSSPVGEGADGAVGGGVPAAGASRGRRAWAWVRAPLALFLISLIGFGLFAWNRVFRQSTDPHFVLLANAFLKGTTEIRPQDVPKGVPAPFGVGKDRHDNDWASWETLPLKDGRTLRGNYVEGSEHEDPYRFETLEGTLHTIPRDLIDPVRAREERKRHYFVSFPPAPAVLMMPLALFRGYKANDVVFTLFFAAFNVALAFVLFRRLSRLGWTERLPWENAALALTLGFGTVHLWCSVLGQVWFTALVLGTTGSLLYLLACTDRARPWLAGLALAFCVAVRPQLAFAGVLFAGMLLFPEGRLRREGWGRAARDLVWFALPLAVVGVLLAWYNHARFGNPLVFGHELLQAGKLERIREWGLFNYHFFPINLTAAFTLLPKLSREFPYVKFSLHGMSLFLSMPFLVYLFAARYREGDRRAWFLHRVLWATWLAVALPGFLYQNTGWEQYGFRFAMDWMAYLFVLIAISRRRLTWLFLSLAVLGFLVNAWGAVAFKRGPPFDVFFDTWLVP